MQNTVFEKYGRARKVKYLVASLDDLKDVVDTVRYMIRKKCDDGDYSCLEDNITIEALPLKNNLSSFILDLCVPESLLTNNGSKSRSSKNGVKK